MRRDRYADETNDCFGALHAHGLRAVLCCSAQNGARSGTYYDGASLVDYDFFANPPQRYVTAYALTVPAAPKTGDDTPLTSLIALTLLSGAGLAISVAVCRRKQAR